MVAEISTLASATDGYEKVIAELEKYKDSTISVPELSRLLDVKTTTINARFRRAGIQANTIGRTNFIPGALALSLADLHKYALKGWPTLQEVSRMTGIKNGTLKARCEKGKLENHIDLTKRLRINPAEVPGLSADQRSPMPKPQPQPRLKPQTTFSGPIAPRASTPKPAREVPSVSTPVRQPFTLPPAPEPRVQVITARDYDFTTRQNEPVKAATAAQTKSTSHVQRKRTGALSYNPERPFSISECSVGKTIKYEQYDGTIVKLIPDPFNPTIKVALPNHVEPLMREIMLRVGR